MKVGVFDDSLRKYYSLCTEMQYLIVTPAWVLHSNILARVLNIIWLENSPAVLRLQVSLTKMLQKDSVDHCWLILCVGEYRMMVGSAKKIAIFSRAWGRDAIEQPHEMGCGKKLFQPHETQTSSKNSSSPMKHKLPAPCVVTCSPIVPW